MSAPPEATATLGPAQPTSLTNTPKFAASEVAQVAPMRAASRSMVTTLGPPGGTVNVKR